jgi:hypothetical protein
MLETQQSQAGDRFETTTSRAKQRAKQATRQTTAGAKEEFGRLAFDALEERFPEQAKERRQGNRLPLLVAGVVLGFLLRHFVGRRS